MGPITYSLCQKPVLGFVMFMSMLCGFPPLFDHVPIALDRAGASATANAEVQIDKSYLLLLNYQFEERAFRPDVLGTTGGSECNKPAREVPVSAYGVLGRPLSFRVQVRRLQDKLLLVDQRFDTLCVYSTTRNQASRQIGHLSLTRGKYLVTVINEQAQADLADARMSVTLAPGGGK